MPTRLAADHTAERMPDIMKSMKPVPRLLFTLSSCGRLSGRQLAAAIQILSLFCIFFEGYDQGLMGGVNTSADYQETVGIGQDGIVTNPIHQGGIVAIYYLGAIVGCFGGGWIADRLGRINGVFYGALLAVIGGALQAGTQSSDMILVARVISGLGAGALTAIIPVWSSEVAAASHRGSQLGIIFLANYIGIATAYWVSFGLSFVDDRLPSIRWRFMMSLQCVPALFVLATVKFFPDSPRFLASVGRQEEAWDVLHRLRGSDNAGVRQEYIEMLEASKDLRRSNPTEVLVIMAGMAKGGKSLARRAWLAFFVQIMASWTGITAVTVYVPTLLRQAGFDTLTIDGLSGGINSIGIIGTVISAFVVDRYGRRKCFMFGALALAVVNFIAAGLYETSRQNPEKARNVALGAVPMLFLFNLSYASTWGTAAFLYPTEIFPAEMRAQGSGFGIAGWAIGCGWTTLLNPTIFKSLANGTYFLFGGLNIIWILIIFLFYPETANRSLESIETLFGTRSPFAQAAEKAYREREDTRRVERRA